LVEFAAGRVVDVLDAGLAQAQLRLPQGGRQPPVFAGEPFGLDQEAEPLVEGDRSERRVLLLGAPGSGEGVEPQGLELLEGRFGEHGQLLCASELGDRISASYSPAPAGEDGPLRTMACGFFGVGLVMADRCPRSVVVLAAADVLVHDGRRRRGSAGRQAIEAAPKDRRDMPVGAGAGGQRPATRRLKPRGPRWKTSTAVAVRRTSRRSCSGTRVCGTE